MFENVIVGVDGCDGGRDATALARALDPATLTLVAAYRVDTFLSHALVADYDELLRKDALRDLEAARLSLDVDAEILAVGDIAPAHALQQVATDLDADLLVIGSAHHGPFGRALLGDVGRAVVPDAPCPVLIAPKRFAGAAPRQIAVGYDGSPEAQAALELGQRMAQDLAAALTVYVVREDPPLPVVSPAGATAYVGDLAAEARTAADRLLEDALRRCSDRTAGSVLHGDPATQLEHAAARHDLLVIGSRRWGAVKRVAVGSAGARLMHRAPCAVLVVPRPVTDVTEESAAHAGRLEAAP